MALTRKFLSAMGIEADKVDEIINAHIETVDGLKEERDQYKHNAELFPNLQKELEELKKAPKDAYKVKYDALKEEFDQYKHEVSAKETKAKKESAFKTLLKEVGVSEKRIESVLKVSDVDSIKFDEEGHVENANELKKALKAEWADFIVTESQEGSSTAKPPANTGGKVYKTKEEIMSISDTTERQKAIAENHEMFGF